MSLSFSIFPTGEQTGPADFQLNSNGNILLVDGIDELTQRIYAHLQIHRGEWFLDQNLGIPWKETIFTKYSSIGLASATITAELRRVDGVERIVSFHADFNVTNRVYIGEVVVETIYGQLTLPLRNTLP